MPLLLRRRTLLSSAGAAALGLPALELINPRSASAAGSNPTRYAVIYAGLSTGRPGSGDQLAPTTTGVGYDLRQSTKALGTEALPYGGNGFDVQDDVSIISGLEVPWSSAEGASVPPGGRSPGFHYNTMGPVLTGAAGPANRGSRPRGATSDQVMLGALGGDSPHPFLSYRVQPEKYRGSNPAGAGGDGGRVSWRDDDDFSPVDPIVNPRSAWESLFSAYSPSDDTAEAEAFAFQQARRVRVLDAVHRRTQSLLSQVGSADKLRLEQHLEEIKRLEERLTGEPLPVGGACEVPEQPGDPPASNNAYSGEDIRAEQLFDMVAMAFACRQTQVAAVRLTMDQCFMSMDALTGVSNDVHELSHSSGSTSTHADALGWHIKHFARFVATLRNTVELDGTSLLDNTAIVMLFEGGYGTDPDAGGNDSSHSTENMCALVAGGAGGMTHGQHIRAPGKHPANATLSAMTAAGFHGDQLGDVTGIIDGLFG